MINTRNYKNFIYIPLRIDELDFNRGGRVVFNPVAHQIDIVRWIGGGLVRSVRAVTATFNEQTREIPVSQDEAARMNVIDELYQSIVFDRTPAHDGVQGMANVELCLAIHQQAKEINLSHQVPTADMMI